MDKEMLEQFQMIMQGMNQMEQRIDEKMQKQTETLIKMMDEKISAAETRINIKIENDVTGQIRALFDGYKLTHEKQWELERQTQNLQKQVEDLQARLAKLEEKIA